MCVSVHDERKCLIGLFLLSPGRVECSVGGRRRSICLGDGRHVQIVQLRQLGQHVHSVDLRATSCLLVHRPIASTGLQDVHHSYTLLEICCHWQYAYFRLQNA